MAAPVILITFAVKQEAIPFQRRLQSAPGIDVVITGIGDRNARNSVRARLASQPARLVISSGFAGGLNPKLTSGTVVFDADENFSLSPALLRAGALPVSFHCSDRIIVWAAEKAALWKSTGSEAVEMESQAIREVSRQNGIPSATVRVISDGAEEDLPFDFNRMLDANMTLNYARLLRAVLISPGKVSALFRFQAQTKMASRRLAEMLATVVESASE